MSIATITRTSYPSPTSQATFLSMLDTAMQVAGFTLYDTKNISGADNKIYSLAVSSAAKGTIYQRMNVNAGTVKSSLMSAWNTSTNTGTSEASNNTAQSFSYTSLATISFIAINSAELKGVLITQGVTSFLLGIIRPANIESWYDESQYNLGFNADNSEGTGIRASLLIPNNNTGAWTLSPPLISVGNPYNNNYRQVKPIEFYHPAGYGCVAYTSSDLVLCAGSGITGTGTDELVTLSGTYLYLGNNSVPRYLAVRTA